MTREIAPCVGIYSEYYRKLRSLSRIGDLAFLTEF